MAKLSIMKGTFERSKPLDTTNYDKGKFLADKIIELEELEKEKAATVKGYNEQIDALESSIKGMAKEINSEQKNLFDGKYPEGKEQ